MNKETIKQKFKDTYEGLYDDISNFKESRFFKPIEKKWSVAQNLAHLTFSAKIINKALVVPKWKLALRFGLRFTGSRPYDVIVDTYQSATFPKVTGFEPKMSEVENQLGEIAAFKGIHELVGINLDQWKEKQLDFLLLPHPILGKITIREMIYFMIYHIKHHHLAICKSIESNE